jgi:hypothetical protein
VKRLILLICVLTLALDLAQDGALGKASFVTPCSPVKSLAFASHHFKAASLSALDKPLPTTDLKCPYCNSIPYATTAAQDYLTRIYFYHISSAGGIPQ